MAQREIPVFGIVHGELVLGIIVGFDPSHPFALDVTNYVGRDPSKTSHHIAASNGTKDDRTL